MSKYLSENFQFLVVKFSIYIYLNRRVFVMATAKNWERDFCTSKTGLTHLCLTSYKRDICKQCRPRSYAAERRVWSGSTLFAVTFESFNNKSDNDNFHITTLWLYNGPIQSSWRENSLKFFRYKWVKPQASVFSLRIVPTWSLLLQVFFAHTPVIWYNVCGVCFVHHENTPI